MCAREERSTGSVGSGRLRRGRDADSPRRRVAAATRPSGPRPAREGLGFLRGRRARVVVDREERRHVRVRHGPAFAGVPGGAAAPRRRPRAFSIRFVSGARARGRNAAARPRARGWTQRDRSGVVGATWTAAAACPARARASSVRSTWRLAVGPASAAVRDGCRASAGAVGGLGLVRSRRTARVAVLRARSQKPSPQAVDCGDVAKSLCGRRLVASPGPRHAHGTPSAPRRLATLREDAHGSFFSERAI